MELRIFRRMLRKLSISWFYSQSISRSCQKFEKKEGAFSCSFNLLPETWLQTYNLGLLQCCIFPTISGIREEFREAALPPVQRQSVLGRGEIRTGRLPANCASPRGAARFPRSSLRRLSIFNDRNLPQTRLTMRPCRRRRFGEIQGRASGVS